MIELIIVIVVVTIAAVAIGSAFAYMSRSLALNEDLQRSWQIAHECADSILAQGRRPRGVYEAITVGSPWAAGCSSIPALPAGYSRVVNVTTMPTGGALCSTGWSCKRVEIVVTKGAITSSLNFMLVQY